MMGRLKRPRRCLPRCRRYIRRRENIHHGLDFVVQLNVADGLFCGEVMSGE